MRFADLSVGAHESACLRKFGPWVITKQRFAWSRGGMGGDATRPKKYTCNTQTDRMADMGAHECIEGCTTGPRSSCSACFAQRFPAAMEGV